MTHGTNACYGTGCRRPECRAAHTLEVKRWHRRVVRNGGKLLAPADETRRMLAEFRKRGITAADIAQQTGLNKRTVWQIRTGGSRLVQEATAAAIATMYAEVQLQDALDARRWPTRPMVEAVRRRCGSVKAVKDLNMRRQLHRAETLSTEAADRYAGYIGCHPVEVWHNWYEACPQDLGSSNAQDGERRMSA